jgi:transcriptional regulator with XRE-family HTH domain
MPATALPVRYCDRCGARLARYNRAARCAPCSSPRALREPPAVPREFWDTAQMRDALATWHMGRVIYAYRTHPWHPQPLKQSVVGSWFCLTQTQVSRIENGNAPEEMSKLIRWAKLLGIPGQLLWFDLPGGDNASATGVAPPALASGQAILPPAAAQTARALTLNRLPGELAVLAGVPRADTDQLSSVLTDLGTASPLEPPGDVGSLAAAVDAARGHYQGCRYEQLTQWLPGLIRDLNASCEVLAGDERYRACALSADAHHVAAGLMLKRGDQGLAALAADRSMRAALASGDPVTIAASARIITHALMNGGHLAAAVSTAASYASSLGRDIPTQTPDSLSVYGALLLRGAVAAAQDDNRDTAHELLSEAEDAAKRLGRDGNLRWTAFGPVNAALHRISIAVTLGDAGTAIDLARTIDLDAIAVTERKATLLIDVARAFIQRDQYESAYRALRTAHETAPEEVTGRSSVRTIVRDLASAAPPSVRRDAAQFAASIGVTR